MKKGCVHMRARERQRERKRERERVGKNECGEKVGFFLKIRSVIN